MGTPHAVRWQLSRRGRASRKEQVWLCNPALNAIFVREASPRVFGHIRREFSRSLSPWRRPFQAAYVSASMSRGLSPVFARGRVGVTPALRDPGRFLITGGNRRVRLIDTTSCLVYGILKTGVAPAHLERELFSRRLGEESGVSLPDVVHVDLKNRWFAERFVTGTPINRLPPAEIVRHYDAALRSLGRLVQDTARDESAEEYAGALAERTIDRLASCDIVFPAHRDDLVSTVSDVRTVASSMGRGQRIRTASTHGDLQAGNVLGDAGSTWLIDWEHAGRRQAGYDWLVANLRPRFANGLADRIAEFEARPSGRLRFGSGSVPDGVGWTTRSSRRLHAAILLLEEVAFRLEDVSASPYCHNDASLVEIQQEASRWLGSPPIS